MLIEDQRAENILSLVKLHDSEGLEKYLLNLSKEIILKYQPDMTIGEEADYDLLLFQMLEFWFDDYYAQKNLSKKINNVLSSALGDKKRANLLNLISTTHLYLIELSEPKNLVSRENTYKRLKELTSLF